METTFHHQPVTLQFLALQIEQARQEVRATRADIGATLAIARTLLIAMDRIDREGTAEVQRPMSEQTRF